MDVHNKKTRSYNMSQIKNKDTKPEIIVRKICHQMGLRYRLHKKIFNTRPDLIFKKHKTVIFVNGCFWHKHNCRYGSVIPKTNTEFWEKKRLSTVERDNKNYSNILQNNWKYYVIWECELKNKMMIRDKIKIIFNII
jgi:DNA mismatch endonuclease, patch repair protein